MALSDLVRFEFLIFFGLALGWAAWELRCLKRERERRPGGTGAAQARPASSDGRHEQAVETSGAAQSRRARPETVATNSGTSTSPAIE